MKKKKFLVIPREGRAVLDGLQTSRGHRKFNGKTYMHISDPTEAREIDQRYGKHGTQDVYVAEDEQYARALNGEKWEVKSSLRGDNVKVLHNYHFGPMTSKAAAEFWERYEKKKKRKINQEKRTRRRKSAEVQNDKTI